MSALIPQPRCPITIREATMDDLSFIDGLQRIHNKMVGFMPEKALVGKIKLGHVIIAEESDEATKARSDEGEDGNALFPTSLRRSVAPSLLGYIAEESDEATKARSDEGKCGDDSSPLSLRRSVAPSLPLGYCIGNDKYLKREELGVIYQLNVAPGKQRGLIGASLVKAMFDRAAYGCKLFCLWCAQDIQANHFWEALGFVPLAFRAGSEKKQRIHIYWCKRIREGDTGQGGTPWWFPSQTNGGSMMEDRLVFPIPAGTHWSDAKPIVLPRHTQQKQLEDAGAQRPRKINRKVEIVTKRQPLCGGLIFQSPETAVKVEKPRGEKKPKIKNDPKFVSAARELRDRWLEHVNENENALPAAAGKYEVCKRIEVARQKREPAGLLN